MDISLFEIVFLSLQNSVFALIIASIISLPIVYIFVFCSWYGKSTLMVFLNTLTGVPTVVIGLLVYILFVNSGVFGFLDLLYTPQVMVIAQVMLLVPIISVLSIEVLNIKDQEFRLFFSSLELSATTKISTLILEAKLQITTILLIAFGRAISEIGAVMIVGGNINHTTRVMTTSIALETSKGNINVAIELGVILFVITLVINLIVWKLKN
jgi:tungstate transport system permease protein